MMMMPPRRRRNATSSIPLLQQVAVFVAAFVFGHYLSSRGVLLDYPTSSQDDDGWHSIHVFYGNLTNTSTAWNSQVGQDELVASLLGEKRNGFFVDLAANDAIHWSNTYALEQRLGWTGLCVEPTPGYWEDLITLRECQVVGAVVGNTSSNTQISWRRRREMSGIVGFDNKQRKGREYPVRYTVPLRIVLEHMQVPHHIDYLSLDVEGAEEWILMGDANLLKDYQVSIMTVERPTRDVVELFQREGFVYLATLCDWGETIWAHSTVELNRTLLKQYQDEFPPWDPETKSEGVSRT